MVLRRNGLCDDGDKEET